MHRGAKPDSPWSPVRKTPEQVAESIEVPAGHDNQEEIVCMKHEVIEREEAFAFLRPLLARRGPKIPRRQETAEIAPAALVFRIDDNVGRAISENEP
jgi:hypothetical protein